MRTKSAVLVGLILMTAVLPLRARADETTEAAQENTDSGRLKGSLTAVPVDYSFVSGDQSRYREQQWSRDGYQGGIEDFNLSESDHLEGVSAEINGHVMPRNNDYDVDAEIRKQGVGYVRFHYQEFSQYFDDTGAFYYPFTMLQSVDIGRNHELSIGEFGVEAGLAFEDLPEIVFVYNRHFKNGTKSRLNYGIARENGVSRGIIPTFQDIDEIVDSFELRESYTLKGFELKGRQYWENMEADMTRLEVNLSTDGVAANNKQRRQHQMPESHLFSVTQSIERWNRKETVFGGVAYHYLSVDSSEVEDIFELNASGDVTSFGSPKQIRNAAAHSTFDSHAWTTSLLVTPVSWLTAITKMRAELMNRKGSSNYPQDTTPDGNINTTEISETEDRVGRIGEGLSLRAQLPFGATLYNDFELEQIRNYLSEDRNSLRGQSAPSAGEIFGRETIVHTRRGTWTIGVRAHPRPWLDTTGHYRYYRHNNDYDDQRETGSTASGAKSAFMDELDISTQELAYRMTLKPHPRVRPSFRYTFRLRDYMPRVEDEADVNTEMDSHIFTADITLHPVNRVLLISGVSFENFMMQSPARNRVPYVVTYNGNVMTWMNSVSWDVTERVNVSGGMNLSHADNFTDFTDSGLPLGVAYRQVDLNGAVRWQLAEALSIILQYGYNYFQPDADAGTGSYHASAVAVKTVVTWG